MNNARLYQVLKGPIISEKSQKLADSHNVQVFKVDSTATKREIKKAVELMFDGIEVSKVNTLNIKGKTRRFGRTIGRRNDYKKAYVTISSSQNISDENATGTDAGEEVVNTTDSASETANNE